MFNKIINYIKEKYNTKKKENNILNNLQTKTTTFQNLNKTPTLNNKGLIFKESFITTNCPDINEQKAKIISNLIPIEETFLESFYIKELLTNKEFYLIPTNKYLWIINNENYIVFYYDTLKCTIIKNNLMSKILLLNNVLIEVTGSEERINTLLDIINDKNKRTIIIDEKTSYLCGIIPKEQIINSINSGISLDNNNNIVFHTKERNYIYQKNQIENYEILLDSTIYSSKKSSTSMGSFQNNCTQISIRITTTDNQMIILPILKPNSIGTKYNIHDSIVTKNLEFATSIINKLNEYISK